MDLYKFLESVLGLILSVLFNPLPLLMNIWFASVAMPIVVLFTIDSGMKFVKDTKPDDLFKKGWVTVLAFSISMFYIYNFINIAIFEAVLGVGMFLYHKEHKIREAALKKKIEDDNKKKSEKENQGG